MHKPFWQLKAEACELLFHGDGGYNREWRCGGTPSWYDGGWTQDGKARNKSLAGYRDLGQVKGQRRQVQAQRRPTEVW